jgi:DNA polymerase III epsilon subunit-like protein
MKILIADLETDGLLDEVTKIHCLAYSFLDENGKWSIRHTTNYDDMRKFFTSGHTIVGHNFQTFDVPVVEKVLGIKVDYSKIICTLAACWFLYPERASNGLESWGEQFGVPKPEVTDWSEQPIEVYINRVREDVKINTLLWKQITEQLKELYGENDYMPFLRYISFKMHTLSIQEKNPFKIDLQRCENNLNKLLALKEEKVEALKKIMPKRAITATKTLPKNLYKKDGKLSAEGEKWKALCEENGLPISHTDPITYVKDYEEPNPSSPVQLKDWLLESGWKPCTYKDVKDKATGTILRKVPQILNEDKELTDSVKNLGIEGVEELEGLGVLGHRIGLLKGFLKNHKNGYIAGSAHGFASTLRMKHSGIVNLPKPNVPYGKLIRGVFTCDEGYELCDSDLASLESKIKLDLIYPYNKAKVEAQLDPKYDDHIAVAISCGFMTKEEGDWYGMYDRNEVEHTEELDKEFKRLKTIRHKAKTTNYSGQYGVGAETLSKRLNIKVAEAKKLLEGYRAVNREIDIVSATFKVKNALGRTYIQNPYNKFWYVLRSEKDKFSAVVQSTGDFICYLWAKEILKRMSHITLVYHDQVDFIIPLGTREEISNILWESINEVNRKLKLNVPMLISVNFGKYFDEIH